jgi:hypothetical protein
MSKHIGVWFMLILACLGGCSTSRTIISAESNPAASTDLLAELDPGDWISVHQANGDKYKGVVTSLGENFVSLNIDPFHTSGEIVTISRDDIILLKHDTPNRSETVLRILGTTAIIYLALALYSFQGANLGR